MKHSPLNQLHIVQITSAHRRYDTRIFHKICKSLKKSGAEVNLIVADGKGDQTTSEGIGVHDVGAPRSRSERIFSILSRILVTARALDADIYHVHDPELIPLALILKSFGKKIIYDSHEDLPVQIQNKYYIQSDIARALSIGVNLFEWAALRWFDGLVGATPHIRDKLFKFNGNTVDINNYPTLDDYRTVYSWEQKQNEVCYIGSISSSRGIFEMCDALVHVTSGTRLNLCGSFKQPELEGRVRGTTGWSRVNALGHLDREGVHGVLKRSFTGLVTLHPLKNYTNSLPVKMFEYMAAGIPVIASNFPAWIDIIERAESGICVDPLNAIEIGCAIDYLAGNKSRASQMGSRGREIVHDAYSWGSEEQKLILFYENIRG